MDTPVDRWIGNDLSARNAARPPIRFWPRASADALDRRTLGNSGTNSNAWTIFCRGNRSTRYRSLACHDGRSWCELIWNVSPASAVLFRNDLYQLFSVVDQAAVVDSEAVGREKGRDHPPSPRLRRTSRSRLQREQNRQLFDHWRCDHFRHFHARKNQAAALHPAGVSVALASARPALGSSKNSKFQSDCYRNGVPMACDCTDCPAIHRAIIPCVWAFSGIARLFAAGDAIRRGRLSRAEPGLVLSIASQRMDDATECSKRSPVHR